MLGEHDWTVSRWGLGIFSAGASLFAVSQAFEGSTQVALGVISLLTAVVGLATAVIGLVTVGQNRPSYTADKRHNIRHVAPSGSSRRRDRASRRRNRPSSTDRAGDV
jgi:hypothetical protein